MSAEQATPVMTINTLIQDITQPTALQTLYDDTKKVRVLLHRNANDKGIDIQLPQLFPFMKLYDLKLAIYKHLKEKSIASEAKLYPEYQFLSYSLGGKRGAVDFTWFLPAGKIPIPLAKPFDLQGAKKVALDFVDENGSLRNLTITDTSKMLIESLKSTELHLYLYDDMKAEIPSEDETKWNQYLHPYFPELSYSLDSIDKKKIEARYSRFLNMLTLATNLNELLEPTTIDVRFKGAVRLQMKWKLTDDINIENLFYSSAVTSNRPYMRLIPSKGVAITKLHLQENNTPDADLARVLRQWTRERNPNPENDYVMAKSVLKEGSIATTQDYPIYMTLRFGHSMNKPYADAIVQPPKGVRKLDTLFTDTVDSGPDAGAKKKFVVQFERGIDKLPYAQLPLQLENATLIYELQIPPKPVFTKGTLHLRLPKFLPFFQEIPPLPGDQPIAMLRYKCVENFTNESRISSFLTQYANLKLIKGETDTAILTALEEQFQLDTQTAQTYLGRWLSSRGNFEQIDANESVESKNTGIDIAIFAKHPTFHFHLHNVNSVTALHQVLRLLAVLFSSSDAQLRLSTKAVEKIKAAEAAVVKLEVEEEEAEAEAVASAPVEAGEAAAEDDDYWKQFAAQEEVPLEEEVRNEFLAAQEDLGEAAPVAAAAAAVVVPAVALQDEDADEEDVAPTRVQEGKIAADFFLNKLKEADRKLFDYTKTHPSLKKYVSICAANVTRQPAVVTKDQYQRMRNEIYAEDRASGRIEFVKYPLEKGEKPLTKSEDQYEEVFYFLSYGTTPEKKNDNLYVCSKYFCARDELIVLEHDFKGTVLRRPVAKEDGSERKTKAPNTCPFCEGKAVVNRRNPGLNETVLVRQVAPKTENTFAKYIGFAKKGYHPDGFHFPCCFLTNTSIYESDKYYDKFRDIRQTPAPAAIEDEAVAAALAPAPEIKRREEAMFPREQYTSYMGRVFTKYIVGSEKLPLEIDELEGPQIGLLPPVVDAYFKQDITNFINPKTPHKLKPDASGFLRIGVENRSRFKSDSFLAAIAPFYMRRSAIEMKALIKQSLEDRPAVFFQLNYGNFLLEYHDLQIKTPPQAVLDRWLKGTDTNNWDDVIEIPQPYNRAVVQRFYISYNKFKGWLDDENKPAKGWIESDDTMKEYRQLAALLAQPHFIQRIQTPEVLSEEDARPGITFIVLDVTADNKLKVRCPPYGFNERAHSSNDIAFLLHHHSGIWEPLFHVEKGSTPDKANFTALFQRGWTPNFEELTWPAIVKKLKYDFEEQCRADSSLSYPSKQLDIHKLATSSEVFSKMKSINAKLNGMMRDPYNHLVALVFEHPDNSTLLIPVPCIDDGYVFTDIKNIYLDWDDLITAPIDIIIRFYKTHLEPEFPLYSPVQLWYELVNERVKVFALALKNRSILPIRVGPPPGRLSLKGKPFWAIDLVPDGELQYYQIGDYKIMAIRKNRQDLEWSINKQLLGLVHKKEEDVGEAVQPSISTHDISDIFEHLRITFAKWLSKKEDGGAVRQTIREIIYNTELTLSEKRKELQTHLGGKILSWFSKRPAEGHPSIQRVDCTAGGEDTCSGRCVWNVDENRCLIHTPDTYSVETGLNESGASKKIQVDVQYLLFFKLIEELLRFAGKRRELFEDRVSQIGLINKRIQEGDQEILPENTAAWYERLRGDWVQSTEEKPKFFEEMSKSPSEDVPPVEADTELPKALAVYLGETDVRTKNLRLFRGTSAELLSVIGYTEPVTLPIDRVMLKTIMDATHIPVGQIDLRTDPTPTAIWPDAINKIIRRPFFILVILSDEEAALLVKNPLTKKLPVMHELPVQIQTYLSKRGGTRQTRRKSRV